MEIAIHALGLENGIDWNQTTINFVRIAISIALLVGVVIMAKKVNK